ncbi:reeler domain containing 1 [Maylandia zebra]|uniref:reeler domain containing 1 n=1 Tax=Maylandia zebra TaxID=106582 RepID=UPI00403D04EB
MLSTLHCLGVCAVLFVLAPPTTSFSGGASHASCQEMIPGHIRAHSQDSQHRQVTIRTSASSYLPGQFITVMVRSSRDFMGFLLQSRRQGPLLVGGSWILTPPGTHTLCCLSEGDTVTHSDKQLKRNLSFVWRAPDSPVGDIRFYITVVQSYFVYWAGIESGLVRDAGRRLWNGSNTTGVNGPSSFASSTIPYLYTSNHPSSDLLFTPAPLPTFTSSQCITNSTNSSISFVSSTTSSSSTSATSSSYQGTSFYIPSVTSPPAAQATSLHSGPSPAPRRSLHNLSMPSPSQKHTEGHTASSDPDPSIHPPTPRTDIHPNPKPHPNIEENLGHELKPKLPNSDAKHPSSPPATPDKEGKYPDIRRHSAWELGMLLGSSAGLGMVLVVGIRYLYRQACGKRTAVTLNDREREYGRGEIGLIHVQECGDLVRVRKIRENSLVLLAEYDVLSPPGERNAGCQQRC